MYSFTSFRLPGRTCDSELRVSAALDLANCKVVSVEGK
jgi:hypothetical protein